MKKAFNFILDNHKLIFVVLLFLLTIVLIVSLFPKEGKFQYEFQKGAPWLHENLMSPFSFAVYKLDTELKQEKDSIEKNVLPYFRYDSTMMQTQIQRFRNQLKINWQEELHILDSVEQIDTKNKRKKARKWFTDKHLDIHNEQISQILEVVYMIGIVDLTGDYVNREQNFNLIKNNISEEFDFEEVFTPKRAYEYTLKEISKYHKKYATKLNQRKKESYKNSIEYKFIRKLGINQFIHPNLVFDNKTTDKMLNSRLESISPTKGMVQFREEIISKGQIVNTEKFRILESLRKEYESRLGISSSYYLIVGGQTILVFMALLILFTFIYNFRKDIIRSTTKIIFILLILIVFIFCSALIINSNIVNTYLMPFAILPIVIMTFFDSRLAFIMHVIVILLIGFLVPNGYEFVFQQLITGIIAILSMSNLYRRSQLFITSGLIILSYSVTYFAIAIVQEADLTKINWIDFIWLLGNGVLFLLSYPLIYALEKTFGFLSDLTLIELSDLNNPLLRDLAEQAPGTFQHSMQVANIAEEAIRTIGGSPLIMRTGALYHDIGKIDMPIYFIENQGHGTNPHDYLEFDKSTKIILEHISKGVNIAKKHKLPELIIDFIRTHHGTSKVLYFYRMYKNKHPDKEVDIAKFTYKGPLPYSKETAVLMMADSIEAASRSMKDITEEKISSLVENIVDFQIKEKQYENAPITFKDISTVKSVFKEKLKNIYHARIEYPKN